VENYIYETFGHVTERRAKIIPLIRAFEEFCKLELISNEFKDPILSNAAHRFTLKGGCSGEEATLELPVQFCVKVSLQEKKKKAQHGMGSGLSWFALAMLGSSILASCSEYQLK